MGRGEGFSIHRVEECAVQKAITLVWRQEVAGGGLPPRPHAFYSCFLPTSDPVPSVYGNLRGEPQGHMCALRRAVRGGRRGPCWTLVCSAAETAEAPLLLLVPAAQSGIGISATTHSALFSFSLYGETEILPSKSILKSPCNGHGVLQFERRVAATKQGRRSIPARTR